MSTGEFGRVNAESGKAKSLPRICQLFQDLVRHGLDLGETLYAYVAASHNPTFYWQRTSTLSSLVAVAYATEFGAPLADVARAIIYKSTKDPFFKADFNDMLWFKDKTSLIAPAGENIFEHLAAYLV